MWPLTTENVKPLYQSPLWVAVCWSPPWSTMAFFHYSERWTEGSYFADSETCWTAVLKTLLWLLAGGISLPCSWKQLFPTKVTPAPPSVDAVARLPPDESHLRSRDCVAHTFLDTASKPCAKLHCSWEVKFGSVRSHIWIWSSWMQHLQGFIAFSCFLHKFPSHKDHIHTTLLFS